MSWLDAQEYCRTLGGNLIYIRSAFENIKATDLASNKQFWTGLSQLRSPDWSWVGVDVDEDYKNWDTHQGDPTMQCAYVFNNTGLWR